jgi:hypothetical protein
MDLATAPTISDRVPALTDLEREAIRQRRDRDRKEREDERESLTEVATRAIQATDCGCEEPGDYLTRELESSFRCPHAVAPGRGPSRGHGA